MKQYLFPYRSVKSGSKIVLYAAGDVGQQYYRQLQATGYCEVVLWLDRTPNNSNVQLPETVATLSSDDYEWVVIAIERIDLIESIKCLLVTLGVPLHKIVATKPVALPLISRYSCLTLSEWLEDTYRVKEELLSYFSRAEGQIEYFELLIQEMRDGCRCNEKLKSVVQQRAVQIIKEELSNTESRLVLLRILLEADCFNKQMMQLYVEFIAKLRHNTAQKYWLIQDLSMIWVYYANVLYEGFWTDKQQLMKEYAEELALTWNPPPYHKNNNQTICIIANGLYLDSITQFVSPIARELINRNYRVHVINLNPYQYDSGTNFLRPKYSHSQPGIIASQYTRMRDYYPEPIHLHYSNAETTRKRQEDVLDLISDFNPCCILDVTDECGLISPYYYRHYPTVYLPIRKERESSSFFHRIVIPNHRQINVQPPIREDQVLTTPLWVEYVHSKREFKRAEFGFEEDDILVVTVGKRLNADINRELADMFCAAMRSNPKVKWVCVGPDEHRHLTDNHSNLIGKQVILWGFEHDLPGLYGICDIYLNPQRFGGGITIAWAMQHGLALASPVGADAGMWYAGEELAVCDDKKLVEYVMKMANSPELLKHNQALMRQKASEWNIERFVDTLTDGMKEIISEF